MSISLRSAVSQGPSSSRITFAAASNLLRYPMALLAMVLVAASPSMAQTAHGGATIRIGGTGYYPTGVAVDGAGNVFFADFDYVKEIVAVNGAVSSSSTVITVASGFNQPEGVAVDGSGNIFVADTNHGAVKEIVAVNGVVSSSSAITTVGSGFNQPTGVKVDGSGNVFVADAKGVKEIVAVNGAVSSSSTVNTVGSGFKLPFDVAVDSSGNVFVGDGGNNAVKEIVAVNGVVSSSSTVNTVGSGFSAPTGVAVDGSGNVFVVDFNNNALKEIVAVNGAVSSNSTVNTVGDVSLPAFVAVDGSGNVFATDIGRDVVEEVVAGTRKFPTTAVGVTSPAQTIYFTFDTSGSLASTPYVVLTQGAQHLDFQAAATQGSDACQAGRTYKAGDVCTVNVTFSPTRPYQRIGAVQLMGASGAPIATFNLRGTGTGPLATFPSNSTVNTAGSGFNQPSGVAVDGSGDVFVADTDNDAVKEIVAVNGVASSSSTVTTVGSGFVAPEGVAVDGSGNVFVADLGHSAVKEIVAVNGVVSSSSTVNTVGSGFSYNYDVAVDGSGNVFVADTYNSAVKEIVAVNGAVSSSSTVNTVGSGFSNPYGVAVDGSGNVFVADLGHSAVKEIVAVNGVVSSSSTVNTVGSGFSNPYGVAVDGSGNAFVADFGNSAVKEIVAVNGAVSSSSMVNTVGSGFAGPEGVAVDGSGNVFVADFGHSAVKEIDRSDPPTLTFAATPVDSTSTDSPQTVTLANIGNADLVFAAPAAGQNPSISANFALDNSATCPAVSSSSAPGTLAAGATCTLPINFSPTDAGSINGSLVLTDNNLNVNPATQTIALSGVGTLTTPTIGFMVANQTYGAAPFAVNATSNSLGAITYSVVSGPATISGGLVTLNGIGTVVLQAAQAADAGYSATTVQTSFSVAAEIPTLTFATIPSETFGNAPFAVSASSTSSGVITYSIVSGPAKVSGNTVTLTGVGTVTLQASQVTAGNYAAATATTSFSVAAETPTLQFTAIPNETYGVTPFPVTATSNSSGAITYSLVSGPAAVSGSTVTLTGIGTVILQASQAATGNYSATTVTTSFTVSPATPTLSFTPIANQTYGAAPFMVSATSNSQGAITYAVVSGPATISGNTVAITGAGPVTLRASQVANGNYGVSTQSASFLVSQAPNTITFHSIASSPVRSSVSLGATASSGLPVSFTSQTASVCAVSGSTATLLAPGTCTIVASQPGNANYVAATPVAQSFTVASAANFTLTANPASEIVDRENLGGVVLTLQSVQGFNGNVTLSCSGGPSGSKCADVPQVVRVNGTAYALSGVLFPKSTPDGTYTVTFTGVSGSLTHSTTVKFTVK